MKKNIIIISLLFIIISTVIMCGGIVGATWTFQSDAECNGDLMGSNDYVLIYHYSENQAGGPWSKAVEIPLGDSNSVDTSFLIPEGNYYLKSEYKIQFESGESSICMITDSSNTFTEADEIVEKYTYNSDTSNCDSELTSGDLTIDFSPADCDTDEPL